MPSVRAAEAGKCRKRMMWLQPLVWLAPDIVEAIVQGSQPAHLRARSCSARCFLSSGRAKVRCWGSSSPDLQDGMMDQRLRALFLLLPSRISLPPGILTMGSVSSPTETSRILPAPDGTPRLIPQIVGLGQTDLGLRGERQPLFGPVNSVLEEPGLSPTGADLQIQAFFVRFSIEGIECRKRTDFCGSQAHLGATPLQLSRCPQNCPRISALQWDFVEQSEIAQRRRFLRSPPKIKV